MSMVAVGAYIRTLREAQRLSRTDVATKTGTHESQIVRIENGEQDSRGSLLLAIVDAVKGQAGHIQELVMSTGATAEDGRLLAEGWAERLEARAARDAANMSDDELDATIAAMEEKLRNAPELLVRVTAFLEGLLEGQSAAATSQRDRNASMRRRWLGRKRTRPSDTDQ